MGNGDKLLVCDKLIELSTECSVLGGAPEGLCAAVVPPITPELRCLHSLWTSGMLLWEHLFSPAA